MGNLRYVLLDRNGNQILPMDETYDEAEQHKITLERIKPEMGPFKILPLESTNLQPQLMVVSV